MKKASEYRQHATECHQLAARANDAEQRAMFITMAETWDSLARDREEHVARQKRIDALATQPATAK